MSLASSIAETYRRLLPDSRLFRFGAVCWGVTSLLIAVTKLGSVEWTGRVDPLEAATLLYSEACLSLALLTGTIALARAAERAPWLRGVAYLVFQSTSLLLVGVNLLDYAMFSQTKVVLQWSVVAYALDHLGDIGFLVKQQVEQDWPFYVLAFAGCYVVAEIVVFRHVEARARRRDRADETSSSTSPSWSTTLGWGAASIVCVGLALFPPPRTKGRAVAREATLHLLYGALRPDPVELPEDVEPMEAPTDLELESTDRTERSNVVLVVLESTRARSATPYEPSLETTPFLAELADRSTVMERAYAVVPHTSKALVAMNCGIPPHPVMPVLEATSTGIPARCLAELLGEQGYRSAFLSTGSERFENRRRLIDEMGYDRAILLEDIEPEESYDWVNYFGFEDLAILEPSRRWLTSGDEPFVATYLTITPHYDYEIPSRFDRDRFASDPLFNRYLNTLHYQDWVLKRLIEQYRELGLYENTVFVLIADHGEAFGEHGRWLHDNVPYEEVSRVTWLIHRGGQETSRRISTPVHHLDLLPTVTDMLGYRLEGTELPGTSVFDAPNDRRLHFRCWYVQSCLATIRGPWKSIYHYGSRSPELFDLVDDPGETDNVVERHSERAVELRRSALRWHQRVREMYRRHSRETTSSR